MPTHIPVGIGETFSSVYFVNEVALVACGRFNHGFFRALGHQAGLDFLCAGVGFDKISHGDSPVWVCNVCVNVRRDASAVLLPMNPVCHNSVEKSRKTCKLLIYKGEYG